MIVGALDPDAWSGLVLSDRPGRGFALRWALERDGARADAADLLYLVHEVGPHEPAGRYARVSFDPTLPFGRAEDTPVVDRASRAPGLTIEWGRSPTGAVMRVTAGFSGALELIAYFPWDWDGAWTADGATLAVRTADGALAGLVTWDRPPAALHADGRQATARFPVTPGVVIHARVIAGAPPLAPPAGEAGAGGDALRAADRAWAARRTEAEGSWVGLPDAVTDNLQWMTALQPETGRRYVPAGRRWLFPRAGGGREHWTIFAWDACFNALEVALDDPPLARECVDAVLATQFENGCVPNWRGRFFGTRDRSQPPVGSFCVLKLCLRAPDRGLLERAVPALERWHAWWTAPRRGRPRRDGDANGLCEWGSDGDEVRESPAPWENVAAGRQRAAWESGQDDLPNWDDARFNDETGTLELDAVDLNSYLALDAECLAQLAGLLGDEARAARHRARAGAIRDAMNALLWDEARGLYLDRAWDGRRSTRVAAANFLPLAAGVPDAERAARMLETLLDPAKFWGPYVVPTISRDDPAFTDQQYWRGTIWPPTNYLLYQGLRRYRFDDVAAQLARRSVALFLDTWRSLHLCRENFDARTGAGGGHRYQSWGPLFALMGIEEFGDVTPWDGLRFGTPQPEGVTTLRRLRLGGRAWDVRLGSDGMALTANGIPVLTADRPVTARHVTLGEYDLGCEVTAAAPTTLWTPGATRTIGGGTHQVAMPLRP